MRTFRIGTRKSALAIKQVHEVLRALSKKNPSFKAKVIAIDTSGDRGLKTSLSKTEGSDFFTRELESALLNNRIDIAVHSANDLPDEIPSGLKIAAITKGIDSRDVLVMGKGVLVKNFRGDPIHMHGKISLEIRADEANAENSASLIDGRKDWGKVYLIGAGPGDPGLITVKGSRLLKSCDAVVYDSLVSGEIIADLECLKICAGKRKGRHIMEQDEINSLLVRLAIDGKNTVRLKGGDPLIFGRGFEEAEYLRKHFVDYEIVPGITAALAASAYAEIPLTKRGVSSHVTLSSGHTGKNAYIQEPGYDGTSVYYMSASNIREIAAAMLNNGAPKTLPAAVVSNASLAGQSVHTGTLESFKADRSYERPAIFITGVSAVKKDKSWFEKKKKILFTGTNPDRYSHLGEIVNNAMIELKPVIKKISLSGLEKYQSIVFTSKHGVKFFFEALYKAGFDSRGLHDKQIFSIGSVTTEELIKHGVRPDIQPVFETTEGLIEEFRRRKIKGQNILLPCSALSYDTLKDGLNAAGNKSKPFVVYKNVLPKGVKKMDLSIIDSVIFTAPSCVKNFKKVYGCIPERAEIIATGRITKEAAEPATLNSRPDCLQQKI